MFKRKTKKDIFSFWFTVGLIAQLLTSPNATVIKVVVGEMDPLLFNLLRAGLICIIALPLIIISIRKFNRYNFVYSAAAGLCLAIAMFTLTYALQYSQASYVVILTLASPVVLVLLTHWLMREKINFRAAAGVTLAALGALVAVTLPLLLSGDTTMHFYPVATILVALNCIFFPLAILFYRKANESGLPLTASQGVSAFVIVAISGAALFATGVPIQLADITTGSWTGIVYSALGVVFFGNMLIIASFKRIGSGATAALSYLNAIVAIVIPVMVLGEQLSIVVVAGGVLILLGVYLTEHHQSRRHFHLMRHH